MMRFFAVLLLGPFLAAYHETASYDEEERTLPPSVARSGVASTQQEKVDVRAYGINLTVDPERRWIGGDVRIDMIALKDVGRIELNLDTTLTVSAVTMIEGDASETSLVFAHEGGLINVDLPKPLEVGERLALRVAYSGEPHKAKRAPWDGGFVWSTTPSGKPWIATAVQGYGCDLWFPCKDALSDEPETTDLKIRVPEGLVVASNGVLQDTETDEGWTQFTWALSSPVNGYAIALNIAPYKVIERTIESVNGRTVPLMFYALPEYVTTARRFINTDLLPMLNWFEDRLGPFPFPNDKIGFVETPHLGMEHQTINAYGNGYRADYHGFDWLLFHELAHEWFGNFLTQGRPEDFWLHEGFASYLQTAYALDRVGEAAHGHYVYDQNTRIRGCEAIVPGDLQPGTLPGGDVYMRGSLALHTLRGLIGEDAFWRSLRRLLYSTATPFDIQNPEPRYAVTQDFEAIVEEEAGRDLGWFFEAYLRDDALPELDVEKMSDDEIEFSWHVENDKPFSMPLEVFLDGETFVLEMAGGSSRLKTDRAPSDFIIDPKMKVLRKMPFHRGC